MPTVRNFRLLKLDSYFYYSRFVLKRLNWSNLVRTSEPYNTKGRIILTAITYYNRGMLLACSLLVNTC